MKEFGTKNHKRISLFAVLVLCFSFIVLLVNTTLAWFVDDSTTSNGGAEITLIGTLSLDISTNFNFKNLALAPDKVYMTDYLGDDIGTYVKTAYNHDIKGAYVRIRFSTTRKNVGASEFIDNSDLLSLYFGDGEDTNITTSNVYDDDADPVWYYNEADDYYYYIGAVGDTNVQFNRGYKTSNRMTNTVKDAEVKIFLTVESVQRQYDAYVHVWPLAPTIFVDWAEADKEARWGQA